MAWTIDTARRSKYIDKIVVSSEDNEILEVAGKYGAIPIRRPAKLATDTASPEPLIFHTMDYLKDTEKYSPDILVYLQPTSPLRDEKDLDKALDIFLKSKATALNSVYEIEKKYLKTFMADEKGYLAGSVNDRYPFMNRQSLPPVYMPNGAIYIIHANSFKKTGMLFTNKTIPFIMDGEKNFDLDTLDDLKRLRNLLKKKHGK